jgi:hypothetical protein
MVPRTAAPDEIPPLRISPSEIADARARAAREADAAALRPASNDARLLGARLRAFGRAEHGGDPRAIDDAARSVAEVARGVLANDREGLMALRAYQAELFTSAFLDHARTGRISDDLVELGGDAATSFRQRGWLDGPLPEDFDVVLRAVHKRRFGKLVAGGGALPLDHVEERVLVRFMMQRSARRWELVLERIDEAATLDPTYPQQFARGVVLYRTGKFEASAAAFEAFLRHRPDGPLRLRAINHFKAALEARQGELD